MFQVVVVGCGAFALIFTPSYKAQSMHTLSEIDHQDRGFRKDYFNMGSRKIRNTEDHLTSEGVPGDKSDDGKNNPRIFSTIDDDTRVIPAVEFRNVTFAYDEQVVLDDIRFSVMRGGRLIVLSASGGGKSTILKLALCLMRKISYA